MKNILPLALITAWLMLTAMTMTATAHAQGDAHGPDSRPNPNVPHGTTTKYTFNNSRIFPGTERDYWVYVPAQYAADSSKPACVMVFQDGGWYVDANGDWRVPVVFDNLIAQKEMPVTIAVMVNPGVVPAPGGDKQLPRFNRSFEYDAVDDRYARFVVEELLPDAEKQAKVKLSTDPNDRAIAGGSSGGIASFVAAWNRPDLFRRVATFIGSYTDLRGGNGFPPLIRKTEPQPIRVFMQDGKNDLDIYSGSWFVGNNDIASALRFAGYPVRYEITNGGHGGQDGGPLFPDAIRYIWAGYPAPVTATRTMSNQPVLNLVTAGETWEAVTETGGKGKEPPRVVALAFDTAGNVYAGDTRNDQLLKIDAGGSASTYRDKFGNVRSLAVRADGRLVVGRQGEVVAIQQGSKDDNLARDVDAAGFAVAHNGNVYGIDSDAGEVFVRNQEGKRRMAGAAVVGQARALCLVPDQSLLLVAPSPEVGKFVTSYQIKPDGTLANGQPYFDLHLRYGDAGAGARAMLVDTNGWLYVATNEGIQVCDQAGRVNSIILNPDRVPVAALAWGGANRDTLYAATVDGKLYRRHTKAQGVSTAAEPIKPPAPRL